MGQSTWGTRRGTELTRRIAQEEGRDVYVHVGFSPEHTKSALRGPNGTYDLAFIDGLHTSRAMLADFIGIRRALSDKAVVVFHDVGFYNLWPGVHKILRAQSAIQPSVRYQTFEGRWHRNEFGTGFVSWGFAD